MKHLSICNFGDCLGVSGNRLTVRSKEGELQEYCLTHLRSICIAKNGISISSNLVQACAARGIRLYFLDWLENPQPASRANTSMQLCRFARLSSEQSSQFFLTF